MNSEEELIGYIKQCYEIYSNSNFESFANYCYSFEINYNEYKKDISKKTYLITNNIINTLKLKNIRHSHREYKDFIKININFKDENCPSLRAKLYIPVNTENFERALNIILKFIIENKNNCNIKLSKIICSEILVITFDDYRIVKEFIKYYSSREELKKEKKSNLISLFPRVNGIGICSEIFPYNYVDTFNNYLCGYYKKLKNIEEINSESILSYLENNYKIETVKLKKEMLRIIIICVKTIVNNMDILKIFDYNGEMNFGSYNPSDYILLLDEKKIIYFENKEKTLQIVFGSEEYLNLCYSIFYKNIIYKNSGEVYYSFFKNIYMNLLEKRYSNIIDLYNIDVSEDIIYKELALISSGYFAYKKLNFEYEEIYLILKIALEKKLKCNISLDETEKKEERENLTTFPFNIEYASKIIVLKNGTSTRIIDYFNNNNILEYIPITSTVNLKDGSVMDAENFLKLIYKFIPEYNSFKELFDNKIDFIEYNN